MIKTLEVDIKLEVMDKFEYDENDPDNIIKQASRSFFLVCNKYIHDKGITLDELIDCLPKLNSDKDGSSHGLDRITSWNHQSNPKLLFQLLDINHDNVITSSEYEDILEVNFSDISNQETVKLKFRDGKTREVTREELFNIVNMGNEEQGAGISNDGNNIFKNTHKSGSIEEIAKDNPDVARFVAIGRWIQDELTKIDINCDVLHMRSLPDGGSINNKEDKNNTMNNFLENHDYNMWIEMTVQYKNSKNNRKNKIKRFEFHIVKDKNKYVRPYLGIINAWVLDNSNNTRISNFTIPQIVNNNNNNTLSNVTISQKSISTVIFGSIVYFLLLLYIVSQIRRFIKKNSNDKKND